VTKVVILAGGMGTRLSEETVTRPKPMVEIGGMPILWHIMKIYSQHNINEFIICLGYKGHLIKEYFQNYFLRNSNVTMDLVNNSLEIHQNLSEPWKITLVDTGDETMTGGRVKAIRPFLNQDEPFCLTYGDGLSDIDITALLAFHAAHGDQATITSVAPPGRFGALEFDGDKVVRFREKPAGDGAQINGGFFVLAPEVIDLIDGPSTIWEREPLEQLAAAGQLQAFRHEGFWQPMDTVHDRAYLEGLWKSGKAPWKVW
jgi:glucose-1-phosphate cytidylyltransferase